MALQTCSAAECLRKGPRGKRPNKAGLDAPCVRIHGRSGSARTLHLRNCGCPRQRGNARVAVETKFRLLEVVLFSALMFNCMSWSTAERD